MKFSELGKEIVLFIDDEDNIVHQAVFEDIPNISTLKNIFEELKDDEEFGVGPDYDLLKVVGITMKEYLDIFGDFELES